MGDLQPDPNLSMPLYYTWDDYYSVKGGLVALASGQRVTTVMVGGVTTEYDHRAANISELSALVDKIYSALQSQAGRRRHVVTCSSKGLF